MRLIVIIILSIIIGLLSISIIGYSYNKTIGEGITDCMIEYVNNYYPNGCTYKIFGTSNHIDKCGLENEYMVKIKEIEGCNIDFFNTTYCYTTLFFENLINNK